MLASRTERTRTCRILVALAAIVLFLALPRPAPAEARKLEIAVQDDLLLLHHNYLDLDLAYRRIRGIKGSRVKFNVLWAQAVIPQQREANRKPKRVRYQFDKYDDAVRTAKRRGMKVQMTLTGPAPAWATPKNSSEKGYFKPSIRKFKKFVKAFARRYRGKVDRFSIWNEPNWYRWLAPPRKAPILYRRLYRAAYKVIKRQHPRARVLIGELVPYKHRHNRAMAPLKFLRKMTCLNDGYRKKKRQWRRKCDRRKLYADGMAHHPYDFKKPPWKKRRGRDNVTIATLGRLTRALDKMKRRRVLIPRRTQKMPVHLTEYGYFRKGRRKISERRRAKWTVAAYKIAKKNPRVRTMLHYVFVQPPPPGTWFDLSIVNTNGSKTRSFKKMRRWTKRQAHRGNIKQPRKWRA